jgi:hypothetical protein
MAWNWVRRCLVRSSPKPARKPQNLWLRCEPLEDRVMPDANNLLPSWLSFRLYSPQTLGASIAPFDPAGAAIWSGQSLAPSFGANSPYSIADGTPGISTPAGGHFLTPGDQPAMPNGELLAPDTTSAAGLADLASPDDPWPTASYEYAGTGWPFLMNPRRRRRRRRLGHLDLVHHLERRQPRWLDHHLRAQRHEHVVDELHLLDGQQRLPGHHDHHDRRRAVVQQHHHHRRRRQPCQ